MRRGKRLSAAIGVVALAALFAMPAQAAEKIEDLTMEIDSRITAGDSGTDVDVNVDTEGCYVDSVTAVNEPEEWEENDRPRLKIVFGAEDDYSFASGLGKDEVALDEDEGTVTSVSRSGSKKLTVYVTLPEVEWDEDEYEDYDLDVYELSWDAADGGIAYWDESDYAKKYEVRLYRDGTLISAVLTTETGSYNFSSYFTQAGDYVFEVRGVRNSSDKGSWKESESRYVDGNEAAEIRKNAPSTMTNGDETGVSPTEGAWLKDGKGYWWCNPDKSYPVNTWKKISGVWYYFDAAGYMEANKWILSNNKWYYVGADGAMLTNSPTPDGYSVDGDGVWIQ